MVRERTLWGLRIWSSKRLCTHTFYIPFLLVMPLCNRTGALYFEHIFSIICWGSFNLSLRFIGTGWLLQGSFWMEHISCRLGLLPVASPWTCNPGLWVTTVKNQWRSLPFFMPPLLACKAHFSLPPFSFCFLSGKERNKAQELDSELSLSRYTAGVPLRRLFFKLWKAKEGSEQTLLQDMRGGFIQHPVTVRCQTRGSLVWSRWELDAIGPDLQLLKWEKYLGCLVEFLPRPALDASVPHSSRSGFFGWSFVFPYVLLWSLLWLLCCLFHPNEVPVTTPSAAFPTAFLSKKSCLPWQLAS